MSTQKEPFDIFSSVAQVVYAQGSPAQILTSDSIVMPYMSRYNGLLNAVREMPAGGFVFLYDQVFIGALPLGVEGYIVFDSHSRVVSCRATSGSFNVHSRLSAQASN